MNDFLGDKLIWLTTRFYWFSESSPTDEAIIKIYDIDKYSNPIDTSLRTYTANSFRDAIELSYEIEKSRQ